jgi:plasmid stabilization system protein ParE
MDYELIISERADELIDRLVAYLLNNLNNPGAAAHFLDELETIYDRLINNPYQFPDSPDEYLFLRGYREALFKTMHYKVIYRIENQQVLIVGVFHTLEDYRRKV